MSNIANFVQRGTYTMLGQVHGLTCFTRALRATERCFCNDDHFSKLGHTPFWHLCVPKGAEMTSLRGGETFAPLPAGFHLYVQPVARVVLQERIFPRHDLHSNH